jgi:2-succinyl-6-hydroxy-2,4-cyclohexadiene-1-carboxylate synthase
MERCVDDVLGALDAAGVGRPTVLGYSMGGRVALHLAVASPERVGCLILVSASAGLMEPAERTARILADEALADFIETQGIEAFVDRWERLPLFASQSALPQEVRDRLRRQRLRNNPVGLANSLRGMGAGQQLLLWDKLPSIGVPTLLVVGEQDEKYCTIARAMAQLIPGARTVVVANAGHAVHLEQPSKFEEIVLGFLYDVGILNESAALAL